MPIFRDHFGPCSPRSFLEDASAKEPSGAEFQAHGFQRPSSGDPDSAPEPSSFGNVDHGLTAHARRAELIERLKRENSPSWQQSRSVSPRLPSEEDSSCHTKWKFLIAPDKQSQSAHRSPTDLEDRPRSRDQAPQTKQSSPPATTPDPFRNHASAGLEIQRPSSALHRGDFREKEEGTCFDNGPRHSGVTLATSPVVPWHHAFPAAANPSNRPSSPYPHQETMGFGSRPPNRARAVSQLAISSPFVFMPPTSPLVQQENNTDLDFSPRAGFRQTSGTPDRNTRRYTISPSSFQDFRTTGLGISTRKDEQPPYQAHQPRRSITAFNQFQTHSTPQTPFIQPRRPSISEISPLHHAPMVGSYEESILRGRMSTTPSRPLNFVARLGVLGRGKCKESLKCPPQVTIPFPAVFYSYNGGNGPVADNSPSPYVGLIDLENSLAPPVEKSHARRKKRPTTPKPDHQVGGIPSNNNETHPRNESSTSTDKPRRQEKGKRRSASPKAPPGGCYRIPQQGQVQIVIKNPNQTAVKLFLVPYDLTGMEPGQKTFVRQRSYSASPVIDMPVSSRTNLGTDRPEAALSNSDDPRDRPVLRYLVHLHICCPSKGRFYLYKSIRVVFANRVPDGKETLRNETQLPDPPYSAYKPGRDSLSVQASSAGAQLAAENAARRASTGFSISQHLDGFGNRPPPPPPAVQFTGGTADPFRPPVPSFTQYSVGEPPLYEKLSVGCLPDLRLGEPFSYTAGSSPNQTETRDPSPLSSPFAKLNKGDAGYGGNPFSGMMSPPGEGLLARKLRGLPLDDPDKSP